ncbi:MAG TPA: hypothetical protein VEP89_02880 [Draconibacterium sp.]|nr:hypothetical protein [Draconibacterium sp.]
MDKNVNKSAVSRAIISKITSERSPKEIRTDHLDGFKKPVHVASLKSSNSFIPDIEVVYENSNIVYEIELNNNLEIEKWQSFSKYVKQKNGSFYLVVPKQMKERVKKELDEKDVNAGVITFVTPY